jgi:L-rhamnose mutarotase
MERIAFKMKLLPASLKEYIKRHNEIWPELERLLKEKGITDYSIFHDESTSILFGYLKIENEQVLDSLSKETIMQRWWSYMKDLMETNADDSPVTIRLNEVFYLK